LNYLKYLKCLRRFEDIVSIKFLEFAQTKKFDISKTIIVTALEPYINTLNGIITLYKYTHLNYT